jgi:hypothetical protein
MIGIGGLGEVCMLHVDVALPDGATSVGCQTLPLEVTHFITEGAAMLELLYVGTSSCCCSLCFGGAIGGTSRSPGSVWNVSSGRVIT